ncbi:fluoride efflux transporter CrcB [Rickettsiales bacterium]|nr:fluoride efflux transporter CrcB [Rickettsiales bacterium]
MLTFLLVGLGGAIGAMGRYFTVSKISNIAGHGFPYGTLCVNVFGSLFMGMLIAYLVKTLPHSNELRAFLAVGILGGFTTFSAFSLDAISLFEKGLILQSAIYVISSVALSIFAVFLGLYMVRFISI